MVRYFANNYSPNEYGHAREEMVKDLQAQGIKDERILQVMNKIPRHKFIPDWKLPAHCAYGDHPYPIGFGQTISQPFIVAHMTELLRLQRNDKVLEIGTGSGYQTAILASLAAEVYTIEVFPELIQFSSSIFGEEEYSNIHCKLGDGYSGWPEFAPFQKIIVTCAPKRIPSALCDQLDEGGRCILPIGEGVQRLVLLTRVGSRINGIDDLAVKFVPMVSSP